MSSVTNRLAAWSIVLAVAGIGGVVMYGGLPYIGGGDDAVNPCVEPLRWRIGAVDAQFDIGREEVRQSVETAMAVWEEPADRRLFEHDSVDGWPIEFVFDDRQAMREERSTRRGRLETLDADLERRQRRYERRERAFRRARAEYERRFDAFREDVTAHNETVDRWNERGGAPASVRERLDDRAAEIEAERAELDRLADTLDGRRDTLEAEAAEIQRAIDDYNALAREYADAAADGAPDTTRSGAFSETVVTRAGWRVRSDRRLTIYQFGSRSELVRVLAHELGHALGLDHVSAREAIMHERYGLEDVERPLRVHEADLTALIARCGVDRWESER